MFREVKLLFENLFNVLYVLFKLRFYVFIWAYTIISLIYKHKKQNKIHEFIKVNQNLKATIANFDYERSILELQTEKGAVNFRLTGIEMAPLNKQDLTSCETKLSILTKHALQTLPQQAFSVRLLASYAKNNIVYGDLELDGERFSQILVKDFLAYPVGTIGKDETKTWCALLELHTSLEHEKTLSTMQDL